MTDSVRNIEPEDDPVTTTDPRLADYSPETDPDLGDAIAQPTPEEEREAVLAERLDWEAAQEAPAPKIRRTLGTAGIAWLIWDIAHHFDADALSGGSRPGRCAIGSFEAGCAHRMPNVRDTLRAVRG